MTWNCFRKSITNLHHFLRESNSLIKNLRRCNGLFDYHLSSSSKCIFISIRYSYFCASNEKMPFCKNKMKYIDLWSHR